MSKSEQDASFKSSLRAVFAKWINDFEYIISAMALIGLVGMLTISILARYVGGISVPWSEEIARFMFIAVIFSSISYAARLHRHIRVTMFVEKLFNARARIIVFTIGDFIWLALNAVVLYGAYIIISDMFEFPFNSAVLNIPMYYIYLIIPIFSISLSIRIIQGIILRLQGVEIDSNIGDEI